ncbi:unnamed protein product [Calypogeia fissa]
MAPKREVSNALVSIPREKKQRRSKKDVIIQKFKGVKLRLQCSAATAVFRLNQNLEKWGVYADLSGIHLCFWTREPEPRIVLDSSIIGCAYRKNVDLEELPEALALLFGEEHDETSRMCICLSQDKIDTFDQKAVDEVAVKNGRPLNQAKDRNFLMHPIPPSGKSISKFILALLNFYQNFNVPTFRFGIKEEMKSQFEAERLPHSITEKNCEQIYETIQLLYTHLDIFDKKVFEISLSKCYTAPSYIKCRELDTEHASNLANSFVALAPITFTRKTIYLYPVKPQEDGPPIPYDEAPTEKQIEDSQFWILGGQHTVYAYKLMLNMPNIDRHKKALILTVEARIFWAPPTNAGYLSLIQLSSALNQESKTNMHSYQFFILAKQVRQLWKHHGSPASDSSNNKLHHWKVCLLNFLGPLL